MQLPDWIIVAVSVLVVLGFGIYTQQYMKSVADFLSAGRVARRYVLAIGKAEMTAGAVIYVAVFEQISNAGFTNMWWGSITAPIGLLVAISGFVVYRYRETRAMTMGQFFEIRYSKNFRFFSGILCFIAGVLNFGLMPMVGSHIMVYFLGLPPVLHFHGWTLETFIPLMGLFLLINLLVSASGGIITIMMTNCIEGLVSQVFYVVLIVGLMVMFRWPQISATLADQPHGKSFLNPMDAMDQQFNLWWVIMVTCFGIYWTMAWPNQSAYNSAPITAHEARMGGLLSRWRDMGKGAVVILLTVCAMTFLHDAHFAAGAAQVHAIDNQISEERLRNQMEIPLAVLFLLPVGLKGALCAVMLLGIFGGDSGHLHSWSSIIIQDTVVPFLKKPPTLKQHLWLLRVAMTGVALFAFIFGIFLKQTGYILMWWNVTTSVYVSGAAAAIIGGLYWKKGTTPAAWAALICGSSLSFAGIIAPYINPHFPLNGTHVSFIAMIVAVTVYVTVSLLTCKEDFNMDRMLHRGAYANITAEVGDVIVKPPNRKVTWSKIIGYDENFTLSDKWIAIGLFGWSALFSVISIFGTIWWFCIGHWSDAVWSEFWYITAVFVPAAVGLITTVWFLWGGIRDTIDLFRRLHLAKNNPLDNGMVIDHQNLDESVLPDAVSPLAEETGAIAKE